VSLNFDLLSKNLLDIKYATPGKISTKFAISINFCVLELETHDDRQTEGRTTAIMYPPIITGSLYYLWYDVTYVQNDGRTVRVVWL